ncbi:MAG: hypothetical protein QOH81_3360 [Sphingomonadales bacterium]|jgi:hypothetical protein|nr:hypothetical protein [Sphingomonadales bacterium]
MRSVPILFLLLAAAHGPMGGGRHARLSLWHEPVHEGLARRDFGRNLRHSDSDITVHQGHFDLGEKHFGMRETPFQIAGSSPHRLDTINLGNGASARVGFVQGRHLGLRFGLPF